MQPAAKVDPAIAALVSKLENEPDYRWSEAEFLGSGLRPQLCVEALSASLA